MKTSKKASLALTVLATLAFFSVPPALAIQASPDASGGSGGPTQQLSGTLKNNPIVKDLNVVVNFLSAAVGIVVVGMLITAGIQYSMAGGSSDAVSKAKGRITNALLALAVYLLLFGFLQWIVPGGLFNS